MVDELRLFRREIKLTRTEKMELDRMVRESSAHNFSDFVRQKILKISPRIEEVEYVLEKYLKIEILREVQRICSNLNRIALQVEDADYITREHIGIILTCVQELNVEINKVVPLSKEFREKYM